MKMAKVKVPMNENVKKQNLVTWQWKRFGVQRRSRLRIMVLATCLKMSCSRV